MRHSARLVLALFLVAFQPDTHSSVSARPGAERAWPLWDGTESVEQYAQRAGLEPRRTLDLGGGMSAELVLIPAVEFTSGIAEPEKPEANPVHGLFALAAGSLLVVALLLHAIVRRIRTGKKFQVSLLKLLAAALFAGAAMGGWFFYNDARKELLAYEVACEIYREANPPMARMVTLASPYYLGVTEVTDAQYERVVGKAPSAPNGALPAEVHFNEALDFLSKLSKTSGLRLTLPIEAEWEFAALGARTAGWRHLDPDLAAFLLESGMIPEFLEDLQPAAMASAGAFGLRGMQGNAWEFCESLEAAPGVRRATEPARSFAYAMRYDVWSYFFPSAWEGQYRIFGVCSGKTVDMVAGPTAGFRIRCDP